jgi:hypothetical protein
MKKFDNIIKDYKIGHVEDIVDAFQKLIDYDIVSCNDELILEPGDTQIYTRDYISDFKSDIPFYYIVNNTEFLIKNKTKLLTFMTPFNPFIIRNKADGPQKLHFKKYLMKISNIHNIQRESFYDNNIVYHYGSVLINND